MLLLSVICGIFVLRWEASKDSLKTFALYSIIYFRKSKFSPSFMEKGVQLILSLSYSNMKGLLISFSMKVNFKFTDLPLRLAR